MEQGVARVYEVLAEWDDEAGVWVATSEDVPGLATEAETAEALMEKLRVLVPELLELNAAKTSAVPFELIAKRRYTIYALPMAF